MKFIKPFQNSVHLTLPDWTRDFLENSPATYPDDEAMMNLVIELALHNVREATGGPFGAAIFDSATREIISIGVNRVVPLNNSTAHAEMMAFMLAQQRLECFRLDGLQHNFVLATSAQPCAMCYGASPWSGIKRIVIGARRMDVEKLTEFDEGPMPQDWVNQLENRGIAVTRDILRDKACQVFREYQETKGIRY